MLNCAGEQEADYGELELWTLMYEMKTLAYCT